MSSRTTRIHGSAVLAAILLLLPLTGKLREARAAGSVDEKSGTDVPATTTQKDQTDISVTVYNSNLALVRDVRQIHLQSGMYPLRFEDVAASIMPATVHFRSLTDPARLSVVEQNYEYDLLDPQKLLEKYVGREVTVTHTEVAGDMKKLVAAKALLLADNNGGTVWKIGDEIVTNAQPYSFPDLPGNLYSRPTLVWTLDNRGAGAQRVEASYLTNNMNWNADYVLNVSRNEKTADLDGWVTLVNNSGAAYANAKLQLVAGEVHRTELPSNAGVFSREMVAAAAPAVKQFQQEGFSEYHLYTLERRTSIQNNESKQISLLAATNISVEKYLSVEGQSYYYRNPQGIGNAIPQPVKVYYRFRNDEKSSLGMPLPAGTVRVYQADSKGGTQFAGEDTISHTPKDEAVRIYVGNAFDVVCERKQTDYKKLAANLYEMEYQITLRNHKDGPVTVEVREPVGGDWEVVNSNYKYTKLDATTIGFEIPVEKDGAAALDYRVRVKW
ncbi:MAG TPA: DUF4139 domain-containing protein [Candidatus Acidoferrales bacterium]|nr:DUF4139 domain-containing protein [Candidatus Acidoferrales bacterium]